MRPVILGAVGVMEERNSDLHMALPPPMRMDASPDAPASCRVYSSKVRTAEYRKVITDAEILGVRSTDALVSSAIEEVKAMFDREAEVQVSRTLDGMLIAAGVKFAVSIPAIDMAMAKWEEEAEEGRKASVALFHCRAAREAAEGELKALGSHWYGRPALRMSARGKGKKA